MSVFNAVDNIVRGALVQQQQQQQEQGDGVVDFEAQAKQDREKRRSERLRRQMKQQIERNRRKLQEETEEQNEKLREEGQLKRSSSSRTKRLERTASAQALEAAEAERALAAQEAAQARQLDQKVMEARRADAAHSSVEGEEEYAEAAARRELQDSLRALCRELGSSYDGLSALAVGDLFSLLRGGDPRGSRIGPEAIATHLSALRVRALPRPVLPPLMRLTSDGFRFFSPV